MYRLQHSPHNKTGILIMCPSLYGGGAERVACRLASGLADTYHVSMLYHHDAGMTYPLDPRIELIAMPDFHGTYQETVDSRAAFTRKLKESLDIRAAISFMYTMNKVNVLSRGTETVICSERNNPAKRNPESLPEINDLYEAVDYVVFQSGTVRSLFSRMVQDHSSIILNPVEVPCIRTGGMHRVVNIGRMVPQKNQRMLIRAFAAFHRDHPDYTLSVYGDGELSEELHALADELCPDSVIFHGHVPDVHTEIIDAEMFVLSSDYEGLSNALLECMMMGFPCISTRCEGSTDVIQSGRNGILVDVGSEEQMADALALLADNAALRESLGVQARISSEQFHTEHIIKQWEGLIDRFSS